jgi:hypothetical protein
MKTAFLVLGAQRSGTSATSHLLSQFGINFGDPKNFIQFDHNPIFFELNWVNQANNQIIKSLGYQYTDFFLPIETDFEQANSQEIAARIQTLIESEWADEPLIGIKDPRISLTFPVWNNLLSSNDYQIKVILVFRHPANFLASNKQLFYNWDGWTDERHLNFWLQLNLAAVYFARHVPIYYLNYDRLLQFPLEEAQKLANFFSLNSNLASQAARVIKPSYSHHKAAIETGNSVVDRGYKLLCSQSLSPADYLDFRAMNSGNCSSEH